MVRDLGEKSLRKPSQTQDTLNDVEFLGQKRHFYPVLFRLQLTTGGVRNVACDCRIFDGQIFLAPSIEELRKIVRERGGDCTRRAQAEKLNACAIPPQYPNGLSGAISFYFDTDRRKAEESTERVLAFRETIALKIT